MQQLWNFLASECFYRNFWWRLSLTIKIISWHHRIQMNKIQQYCRSKSEHFQNFLLLCHTFVVGSFVITCSFKVCYVNSDLRLIMVYGSHVTFCFFVILVYRGSVIFISRRSTWVQKIATSSCQTIMIDRNKMLTPSDHSTTKSHRHMTNYCSEG